jgi:hypothetical protein
MAYEIVEFEKLIESQYITRSIQGRADELVIQAKGIKLQKYYLSKLSNLSLQLYGIMLKTGYVKSDQNTNTSMTTLKNTSLSLTRINLVSEKILVLQR